MATRKPILDGSGAQRPIPEEATGTKREKDEGEVRDEEKFG